MARQPRTGTAMCLAETQSTIQTSCLDYIYNANDTENGIFYQDVTGVFTFLDRHYVMTNSTSTTSQATYADDPAATNFYEAQSLLIPSDSLDLWTDVQVQRNSGAAVAGIVNPSSGKLQESANIETQALLGYSSLQRASTMFQDDQHAQLLADWLRFLYSTPKIRVSSIMLSGEANNGVNFGEMLVRKLLDRVTVKRQSPGAASQFSQDLVVESIKHQIAADPGQWRTTFTLSPFEIVDNPFILNTSTLDGPAVLVG